MFTQRDETHKNLYLQTNLAQTSFLSKLKLTTGSYRCDKNKSEGSPPPYIIYSDKKNKNVEDNLTSMEKHRPYPPKIPPTNKKFFTNLLDLKEGEETSSNALGLKVTTTKSGSMTQIMFYDYCCHFVTSLPLTQRKHGDPVILFLDGHVSRWNIAALRYLMLNNVFPFFFASHTTIWSQPNDNGTIKRLHSCIEEATLCRRRWNRAVIPYFNEILVHAWQTFLARESSDLIAGGNNATGAFARTGLFPFNPTSDSWEEAIDFLGIHKTLDLDKKSIQGWEIQVVRAEENRVALSKKKEEDLRSGLTVKDKMGEVLTANSSKSILLLAKMRGDGVLSKWRDNVNQLLEEKKYNEAKLFTPMDLEITDNGDKAALKLVKFVRATSNLTYQKTLLKTK